MDIWPGLEGRGGEEQGARVRVGQVRDNSNDIYMYVYFLTLIISFSWP